VVVVMMIMMIMMIILLRLPVLVGPHSLPMAASPSAAAEF
jgi:hypothetical protein